LACKCRRFGDSISSRILLQVPIQIHNSLRQNVVVVSTLLWPLLQRHAHVPRLLHHTGMLLPFRHKFSRYFSLTEVRFLPASSRVRTAEPRQLPQRLRTALAALPPPALHRTQ
jgi:hypothetical protein